jgi:hypothetical protein
LICRPFMQFLVGHAIMLHAGAELGHNFVGTRSNFEWGDNAVDQTKIGTYIFYSKAVVFEKLFVTHIKDIVCKKYLGGGNTEFMDGTELDTHAMNNWVPYSVKSSKSLIALRIPKGSGEDIPMHIPMSGKFEGDIENGNNSLFFLQQGLRSKLHFDKTVVSMHSMVTFYDPDISNLNNSGLKSTLVLSMGYHETTNSDPKGAEKSWTRHLGRSFLGNDIYPGCEQVLNGVVPTFKSMEYEKVERFTA